MKVYKVTDTSGRSMAIVAAHTPKEACRLATGESLEHRAMIIYSPVRLMQYHGTREAVIVMQEGRI